MRTYTIRPISRLDEDSISKLLCDQWGDRIVISRGKIFDAATLPGFIAVRDDSILGLVTLHVKSRDCEVVTLDAINKGEGIGTALLKEAETFAYMRDCSRLWLITSNDNMAAITFYQKLGFRMIAIHLDAITEARKIKPQIPEIADNGIPIRDEIELQKSL